MCIPVDNINLLEYLFRVPIIESSAGFSGRHSEADGGGAVRSGEEKRVEVRDEGVLVVALSR